MLTMLATGPQRHSATELDCQLCGSPLHSNLLDLGPLPVANRSRSAGEPDALYPLHVRLCDHCGLAQTTDLPPRTTPTAYAFAEPAARPGRYAEILRERFHLNADSLVIDIGRTDSPMLPRFAAAGIPVLRVPSGAAVLDTETAMEIAVRHGCADMVLARDVLPHAPDLFGFAAALACILRPNGVVSLQFPHLLSLIQRIQFDAFGHDTCTYLSLPVTERLLRSVGLRVFDAERIPDEGGSLRLHACHAHSPRAARPGLKAVRQAEAAALEDQPMLYAAFSERIALVQEDIRTFLRIRQEANRRVAAYGATARGAMLLNGCGMTLDEIAYVADADPAHHGRLLPGSRIPIVDLDKLTADRPDDLIVLPWPSATDVIQRFPPLRQSGAQLWTVLPRIARV